MSKVNYSGGSWSVSMRRDDESCGPRTAAMLRLLPMYLSGLECIAVHFTCRIAQALMNSFLPLAIPAITDRL